jgi:hypothetical protein
VLKPNPSNENIAGVIERISNSGHEDRYRPSTADANPALYQFIAAAAELIADPDDWRKLQPLSSRPSRGALVSTLSKCRSRPAGQETAHPEPWHGTNHTRRNPSPNPAATQRRREHHSR